MSFLGKFLPKKLTEPKEEQELVNVYETIYGQYGYPELQRVKRLVPKSQVEKIREETRLQNEEIVRQNELRRGNSKRYQEKQRKLREMEEKQTYNAEVARCRDIVAKANGSTGGKRKTRRSKRASRKTRKH